MREIAYRDALRYTVPGGTMRLYRVDKVYKSLLQSYGISNSIADTAYPSVDVPLWILSSCGGFRRSVDRGRKGILTPGATLN